MKKIITALLFTCLFFTCCRCKKYEEMGMLTRVEYRETSGIFPQVYAICTFDNTRIIATTNQPESGFKIGSKYKLDCYGSFKEASDEK